MPTEKKLRVFKIEDSGTVEEYSIRDSHINLAYGVCSTDEATTAKVVTLTNDPGWELKSGSMISVKFLYPVSVASTLNVDGTGAKDIWQHGAAAVNVIRANDTVQLIYDGTRYSILAIDSASQLRAGEAGGLATLDASGKIPGSQLPSYVDDVLEFVNRDNFPATGEAGKIYVDTSSNESYRWSGSTYIRIDDVDEFVGATSSSAGSAGLVPAPASGDQHKFLGANGQWNDLDASMDIDISLPVNGWSATQPYTYTWLNSNVTDGCTVKVYFLTGSEEDDTLFLEFEKVAGGVRFTAPTMPTDPIPVRIHLIYFETGINDQQPMEADRISTDVVRGAANVEEALTTLDTNIKAKLDKPVNVSADRFLRTDANGQAVWAAAASSSEVADAVSDWLSDNITTGQTIALDESLTVSGAAGDAKATGDRLNAFADATTGIVAVSATQPQSADNRLWINDSTVEEYSVPTYAEHTALNDEVTELKDAFDDITEEIVPENHIILSAETLYSKPETMEVTYNSHQDISVSFPYELGNPFIYYNLSNLVVGKQYTLVFDVTSGGIAGVSSHIVGYYVGSSFSPEGVATKSGNRYTIAFNCDSAQSILRIGFTRSVATSIRLSNFTAYEDGEPIEVYLKTDKIINLSSDNFSEDFRGSMFQGYTIEGKEQNMFDINTYSNKSYINGTTGEVMATGSLFIATDYINVSGLQTVYMYGFADGYYAFYDSSKQYISGKSFHTTTTPYVNVPSGATYGRFSADLSVFDVNDLWINTEYKKPTGNTIYSLKNIVDNPENPCDFGGDEISLFHKGICVGDSLTQGVCNYNEGGQSVANVAFPNYSYPTFLKKLTGCEITNKGSAGMTTAQWYTANANYDTSGHDFAIIQLGVNDAIYNSGWSQEEATALQNIITKLKAENNKIKIFVATIIPAVSYSGTNYDDVSAHLRTFVQNLADSDVILLDIAVYGHTKEELAYNAGHLSGYGYFTLAKDYKAYISWYISTHKMEFRQVQFIGTEHSYNI